MKTTKDLLENHSIHKQLKTVNSRKDNTNTVNSNPLKENFDRALTEFSGEPNYVADQLAQRLGDRKSFRYYQLLAGEHDTSKLLEALSITLDAYAQGKARFMPVYFQGILRNWGMKTRFSKH